MFWDKAALSSSCWHVQSASRTYWIETTEPRQHHHQEKACEEMCAQWWSRWRLGQQASSGHGFSGWILPAFSQETGQGNILSCPVLSCSSLPLPLYPKPLLYLSIMHSLDGTSMLPRLLVIRIADVGTFAFLMDLDRKPSAEGLRSHQYWILYQTAAEKGFCYLVGLCMNMRLEVSISMALAWASLFQILRNLSEDK